MSPTTQPLVDLITDARASYHDLITGKAARVVVDANGERVEFVAANSQKLYMYIQQLESQLNVQSLVPSVRGPAGFLF